MKSLGLNSVSARVVQETLDCSGEVFMSSVGYFRLDFLYFLDQSPEMPLSQWLLWILHIILDLMSKCFLISISDTNRICWIWLQVCPIVNLALHFIHSILLFIHSLLRILLQLQLLFHSRSWKDTWTHAEAMQASTLLPAPTRWGGKKGL